MKMEALEAELADVIGQIKAIERIWQDQEESQKKKLTDARKNQRATDTRALRRRKKELEKEIAELKRNPPSETYKRGTRAGSCKERGGETEKAGCAVG